MKIDKLHAVSKIYDNSVSFNPACFRFTEEEARKKGLWRDSRPMPTQEQLESVSGEIEIELNIEKEKDQLKDKNRKLIRKIKNADIDLMDLSQIKELLKKLISLI
ncbi:MAG: hypothetical protein ACTSRG_13035 [Candidatus Helarchaeota archaeon]